MKYLTLAVAILLMSTGLLYGTDVTIKNVPDEIAGKIRAYAQIEIDRFEDRQNKEAMEELIAGNSKGAVDIVSAYKITTDRYRDANNIPQKWDAYKVEDGVNWTDLEPFVNWTDMEIIK